MNPEVGAVLWRLVDEVHTVGGVDLNGEWRSSGRRMSVRWVEYYVESVTRCGMWVRSGRPGDTIFADRRWVTLRTRYVASTREDAQANAIAKRTFHVAKCRQRLEEAEQRLRALHLAGGDR